MDHHAWRRARHCVRVVEKLLRPFVAAGVEHTGRREPATVMRLKVSVQRKWAKAEVPFVRALSPQLQKVCRVLVKRRATCLQRCEREFDGFLVARCVGCRRHGRDGDAHAREVSGRVVGKRCAGDRGVHLGHLANRRTHRPWRVTCGVCWNDPAGGPAPQRGTEANNAARVSGHAERAASVCTKTTRDDACRDADGRAVA
mmetsp:Transcript_43293/g.120410  ORF Transcript_43293/g.120410 Transcript_43293/m.120410 type:complete len:200 (+) Transcript_43293:558-1157(+)